MKLHRRNVTTPYVLRADRDSEKPTVFNLRRLNWKEMKEIQAMTPMDMSQASKVAKIVEQAKSEKRELTDDEQKQLLGVMPMTPEVGAKMLEQHGKAVELGLVSIENLLDEDGNPFELSPAEFLDMADAPMIHELGAQLIAMSVPSGDTAKN